MAFIHRLPSHVIDRIAAGEVIERPASVVKELLENAVDAGAGLVEVDVEGGGIARISVSDDGCGMDPEDVRLAVERHATSKLERAEDLFDIETLGFRGEALSSIASVSRFTLTSRRAADGAGTRIVVEGGEVREVSSVGCPAGTTVDVRDLFYNTPARRKFTKAPATEQSHVIEACARVALGARCGVLVRTGDRRLLDVPAAGESGGELGVERGVAILRGRTDRLLPFASSHGEVRVEGLLAAPDAPRRDSKGMWIVANGRFVRDRTLQRAVVQGYGSMLDRGRYPVCVVRVFVPNDRIDVNVHPQKLEVRFADSGMVFRAVAAAVTRALAQGVFVPFGDDGAGIRVPPPVGPVQAPLLPIDRLSTAAALDASRSAASLGQGPLAGWDAPARAAASGAGERFAYGSPAAAESPASAAHETVGGLTVVAAVGAFLLCRAPEGIAVVDAAGVRARACSEDLRAALAAGDVPSRAVLFPDAIEPSGKARGWLERRWESLQRFGFEVEPVGPGRFAIRALPEALGSEREARALVQSIVDLATAAGDGGPADDAVVRCCAEHAARTWADVPGVATLADLARLGRGAEGPSGRPLYRVVREEDLAAVLAGVAAS